MLNFDTDLDVQGVTRTQVVKTPVPIEPTARREERRTDVLVADHDWTWEQMRDYVVSSIEDRFGPFPRDPRKEKAIFSSFIDRWNGNSVAIAKAAFEVFDGVWHSAPIGVNRFCKNSDPYFASKIAERLS